MDQVIHIIGGGTTFTVRPHLELAAKAFGGTARRLAYMAEQEWKGRAVVQLHLTKMASNGAGPLETNDDVRKLLIKLVADPTTKVIFMPVALCDYTGQVMDGPVPTPSGEKMTRLKTKQGDQMMLLSPANKLISDIRKYRKDIFLVGFKTTTGATEDEQYFAGLELVKKSSCNLVLANDLHTRLNMVVTPEQARYHVTTSRTYALQDLVEMTFLRSQLKFTRATVVPGNPVPWDHSMVPDTLRDVVNYCIARGAYKPFLGSTVGHFAVKIDDHTFLTSRRKTNYNELSKVGLVRVETNGPDKVTAYGSKPSVGGQSQRIVFTEHPNTDCIVHAHVPLRPGSEVPVQSQRAYECGSHECGQNTSNGLKKFGNLWAVMLDKHGPNIVFNRNIDPGEVIKFIEENFDLQGRTDEVKAEVEVPTGSLGQYKESGNPVSISG